MPEKTEKSLLILKGEIKTPPLSEDARVTAGYLLRRLQQGDSLSMPDSRPMPIIGNHCHELRIKDGNRTWRIIYRIDEDAIIVGEVFAKKTRATPQNVIDTCKTRFRHYDEV